jgi:cell division protein FtsW
MAQIGWQVFCNIAVVTNTLPNTGISLPFFSSGGTSLILLLVEMGVLINIARNAEAARVKRRQEEMQKKLHPEDAAPPIVLEDVRRERMQPQA